MEESRPSRKGVIYREAFDAEPEYFRSQVDYVIRPTIRT
jgi:hypothetical protein